MGPHRLCLLSNDSMLHPLIFKPRVSPCVTNISNRASTLATLNHHLNQRSQVWRSALSDPQCKDYSATRHGVHQFQILKSAPLPRAQGLLEQVTTATVNLVNADLLAKNRGLTIIETTVPAPGKCAPS